ncbi:MAG: hypothetical protein ONA90_00980 [candidate division KSB1 bacterium]|nr:hypothetical protein [candidate division KSB1 bacterium]
MLFRFLFWALILYLIYRLFKALFLGPPNKQTQHQVRGKPKQTSLDLSNLEVEDAKFEEIEEKPKPRH